MQSSSMVAHHIYTEYMKTTTGKSEPSIDKHTFIDGDNDDDDDCTARGRQLAPSSGRYCMPVPHAVRAGTKTIRKSG